MDQLNRRVSAIKRKNMKDFAWNTTTEYQQLFADLLTTKQFSHEIIYHNVGQ